MDQFPRVDFNIDLALELNLIKLMCPDCGAPLEKDDYFEAWNCSAVSDEDYIRLCDYSFYPRYDGGTWIALNDKV